MTSSIAGSSSPFLKQLETNGLSASKAALVQKDLSAAQTATTSASGSTISPATRAAFDAKISADVLSGKLSASDAASVRKTMDNLGGSASSADVSQGASTGAASSQAGTTAGAAKAGGGGGGGGGGGSKTELSETVTISGSTMTTVITYTDGTTSTTSTTATDADKAKYDKAASSDQAGGAAAGYEATIDKGAVFDKLA